MSYILAVLLLSLFKTEMAYSEIRVIHPKNDEILQIRTSLGMATLVYPPSPLQPSIIGDISAFRIDMFPEGLSVKPLRANAKTNLFIITEKKRYNLRLITVPGPAFDDVVYIKETSKEPMMQWKVAAKSTSTKELTLTIKRIGFTPQGFLIFEGFITSSSKVSLKPEMLWVLQEKKPKVIHSLYLSSLQLQKSNPIQFAISLAKSDLNRSSPIVLELRRKEILAIQILKEGW